jgi:hypothetical protein
LLGREKIEKLVCVEENNEESLQESQEEDESDFVGTRRQSQLGCGEPVQTAFGSFRAGSART